MEKYLKEAIRYTGLAIALLLMLTAAMGMLKAILLFLGGIMQFVLFNVLKAVVILAVSLFIVSIGFRLFEYFGEKF